MGAGAHGAARALPAAAVVAAHTAVVTEVSRREVEGGSAALATRALAATGAVAAASAGLSLARAQSWLGRAAALGLVSAYAGVVGRAHADAIADPSPQRLQRAVGTGILGLIPLEAGLLAGAGALGPAAAVASLWPVARKLARKRAVT
jgi:4-hydroxybenzoate polyprenyltransferase